MCGSIVEEFGMVVRRLLVEALKVWEVEVGMWRIEGSKRLWQVLF